MLIHLHRSIAAFCYNSRVEELWQNVWLRKMKILSGPLQKKVLYSHSLCLECSSTHFSHEHLSFFKSQFKHHHFLKQPFLDLCSWPYHFFLYHCILFSCYFIPKRLLTIYSMSAQIRCVLFTNIFLTPSSEPDK